MRNCIDLFYVHVFHKTCVKKRICCRNVVMKLGMTVEWTRNKREVCFEFLNDFKTVFTAGKMISSRRLRTLGISRNQLLVYVFHKTRAKKCIFCRRWSRSRNVVMKLGMTVEWTRHKREVCFEFLNDFKTVFTAGKMISFRRLRTLEISRNQLLMQQIIQRIWHVNYRLKLISWQSKYS